MALSSASVFEVRAATGSNNNGGFFVAGASGTDFSQADAPTLTVTDAVTTGTTTVTSVTGGFLATHVGNGLFLVGDGLYEIKTRVDTNTITVDRATGTATGQTANVGGAIATLNHLATVMVASNVAWAKGAFTSTATITFAQGAAAGINSRLFGYGSTRGDATHATLTLQTNTGLTGINCTGSSWEVAQIDVNCASLGTSTGINISNQFSRVERCKVSNFTTAGFSLAGAESQGIELEATGGGTGATGILTGTFLENCWVHDNAGTGVTMASGGSIHRSIVANNSGASSDGIVVSYQTEAVNNTCHNNGRDGVRIDAAFNINQRVRNNILTSNGGYGLRASAAIQAQANFDGNAYHNNTSGTRNNVDATTGNYGINPYTNVRDVTLTGSPYVGPTSGGSENFGLNDTAGAGAACKAVGTPGAFPGLATTVGFLDLGAVQAEAPAASGGSHFIG